MTPTVAKVVVDIALDREFDYRIPLHLAGAVQIGSRVAVPFARRTTQGYVVGLADRSTYPNLKEIGEVVGKKPLLSDKILELARWMARYYCCRVESAVRCALPEVVRKAQVSWQERQFAKLGTIDDRQFAKLRPASQRVIEVLRGTEEVLVAELAKRADTSADTIKRLAGKGFVVITDRVQERDPFEGEVFLPTEPLTLNAEQEQALTLCTAAITQCCHPERSAEALSRKGEGPRNRLQDEGANDSEVLRCAQNDKVERVAAPKPVLIYGVTGSGKTEIYLQAITHCLHQGRDAIVLVPEISLTPQTVERFRARFPNQQITVLHSHLSEGERHDQWHKIRNGESHIVIGARSAVFAPVQALGLIVVDEEHENSYKQDETPRYNARDLAVMRGKLERAAVVLGSATPSLESFYNARRDRYVLATLSQRVDRQKMPLMRIVDMRQEAIRARGLYVLSRRLRDAIQARLDKKEQVILFLNRRGFATHVFCPKCGYVVQCPNCSVSLIYHRKADKVLCHLCGHAESGPKRCPNNDCRAPDIRMSGMGTEKVEKAIQDCFPQARVQRMDSDVMTRKSLYREILGTFRVGKIDILVGTQMIAKGLHFPNVTLVGIIHADMALHLPDFRAGERTFQLLVQVAGRAGRGDVEGEVFVQSFTPFYPAIQHARHHDYLGFYEQEIEVREQLSYPPVTRMVCLTFRGRNETKVAFYAGVLAKELQKHISADVFLGEPSPAPLAKIQHFYRYHLMLRTPQILKLTETLAKVLPATKPPDDVTVSVDVDPLSLL